MPYSFQPPRWSMIIVFLTCLCLFVSSKLPSILPQKISVSRELHKKSYIDPDADTWERNPRGRYLDSRELSPNVNLASGQTGGSVLGATSNDYSCGPGRPCENKSCCGKDGWCGFNQTYCGTGCQSNCNAKAECGVNANPPGKTCPLNVCCSEYGFCGTTSDFCGNGCQSMCEQPKPKASSSQVQKKVVAYWEGWNSNHACGTMSPQEIPVDKITHLFMAFAYITPDDYRITNMPDVKESLYEALPALKSKNPDLKVAIALGGWTYNDPGPSQRVFGTMVASPGTRQQFISNLFDFLSQYGFDGVDFDWEYPGAEDRGGSPDDGINFTQFLKELKATIKTSGKDYFVTFTAPTSYWYLRHFDLTAMTEYVDWIQLMSYDLHGVWDRDNPIGNNLLAHTNLTEIDLALDLFWRNDIDPDKIVLGFGFYGRSFQLSDTSCWKPGCQFSGPGAKGECTDSAGILSYKEITDIISRTGAKSMYDSDAQVNYMVYKGNNWISYDDKKSIQAKVDFANKRVRLNGVMLWAVDQDNDNHDALEALSGIDTSDPDTPDENLYTGPSTGHDTFSASKCFIQNECGKACPYNHRTMTRISNTDWGYDCQFNNFRYLCCPAWSAPDVSKCHWADNRTKGVESDCAGSCNVGQLKLAGDSYGWQGDLVTGHPGPLCRRGGAVYCCDAGNAKQYLDICSWTECGTLGCNAVPGKPYELTTDEGGPVNHCKKGRSLCCPEQDSFKSCQWHWGKACSESCPDNQIELDSDPRSGAGNHFKCYGSRQASFCCDPPTGLDNPFAPVDLENIFPSQYLPAPKATQRFDLVTWDEGDDFAISGDPSLSNVAFFLIAGDSYAISHLKKREGEPEPFTFLDCPTSLFERPDDETQVARVVCFNNDTEACFRVRERGVEGTIVEMPRNCGHGSWARAISLQVAKDQTIHPRLLRKKSPTSKVYEFAFDYNMQKTRRDAGPTSIRIDYSNAKNYWDTIVDAPGIEGSSKRHTHADAHKSSRYFSSTSTDWKDKFNKLEFDDSRAKTVNKQFSQLLYFESQNNCPTEGTDAGGYPEAFAAGINGKIDAKLYFGFSLVATADAGKLNVHESAGFIRAEGQTSVWFDLAGVGQFDASKLFGGNPSRKNLTFEELGGHKIFKGWVHFSPWLRTSVALGSQDEFGFDAQVAFDGKATMRVESDLGKWTAHWPATDSPQSANDHVKKDVVVTSTINVLYGGKGGGSIRMDHEVELGLEITLSLPKNIATGDGNLPSMSIRKSTTVDFDLSEGEKKGTMCMAYRIWKNIVQVTKRAASVGWVTTNLVMAQSALQPDTGKCYDAPKMNAAAQLNEILGARQASGGGHLPGWNSLIRGKIPSLDDLGLNMYVGAAADAVFKGARSMTCLLLKDTGEPCCGCICTDQELGYIDITSTPNHDPGEDDDDEWGSRFRLGSRSLPEPYGHSFKRAAGVATKGTKKVTLCPNIRVPGRKPPKIIGDTYPSFPANENWPWEGIEGGSWDGIARYYHNASGDCSNWGITQSAIADQRLTSLVPFTRIRANYHTEHVFEGQLIGDFFGEWLVKGRVYQQNFMTPERAQVLHGCSWINEYIKGAATATNGWPWERIRRSAWKRCSFIQSLLSEIGSVIHTDRLTIYLARPNEFKGAMFSLHNPVHPTTFSIMDPDTQCQVTKEWGMTFSYINRPEVWTMFCASFEAIYTKMIIFDNLYTSLNLPGNYHSLADEWSVYMRVTLDNIALRARENLDYAYNNRKIVQNAAGTAEALYEFKWYENIVNNRRLLNIPGTCTHLGPMRIPLADSGTP